ncbi:MAG TPA: hypothetical protein VNR64_01030, partial [Vicinamibacterales bacterium]|nr:hypothetical protein [Vicinamibacterales bacterium]
MPVRRRSTGSLPAVTIITAGAVAFAAHAACYLYFFVDDSAIPAVYAQNLLAGRGLVYNALEGRVEGYSDFLHVLINAVLLALTRVMQRPKIEVLHIGMAVSFALGIGTVILAGALLARSGARTAALVAGVAAIALAGPVAVWSCASLETVPFAFFVTALAGATLFEPLRTRAAAIFAIVAVLYRLDGFVFVGAVLAGAFVALDRRRRYVLLTKVCVPVALATAAYHLFRLAYFHSLLSAPLEAKVLYKLSRSHHVLVKAPEHSYLRTFIDLYGVAIVPAMVLAAAAIARDRRGRGLIVATALMAAYAGGVGDWMFGWRFLVPVLPIAALIIGLATARLRPRVGWAVAAVVIIWSAIGARAVGREFTATQHKPIWWTSPRAGQNVWLAPYGDLVVAARKLVAPGETIAYNQAGLVPFLLDAENIDDLGICSSFEARLPTTDVYFTEVGRYAPLTDAPVFNAVHAYLLYRNVRMIVSRTDLLTSANHTIPRSLLGGYYALRSVDASGENAIYLRTDKPADDYQRDPSLFQENLAHISRIQRADVDGLVLPDERIGPSFPFLRWQTGSVPVHGTSRITLRFSAHDEDVATLYAGALSASSPVTVAFSVFDESGRRVATAEVQAGTPPAALLRHLPAG